MEAKNIMDPMEEESRKVMTRGQEGEGREEGRRLDNFYQTTIRWEE